MPTRLSDAVWAMPLEAGLPSHSLYGWRLQGADDDGLSLDFDVFKGDDVWHVHRSYE